MTTPYRFVTADEDFVPETVDSDFQVTGHIVSTQEIPQSFLDAVAAKRDFQDRRSFAQLTKGDEIEKIHIARIPVVIVNKWAREGFDLFQAMNDANGTALILAKLRVENLTAFQTTSKTF